jgi:molybdopterin converting factor small subunit
MLKVTCCYYSTVYGVINKKHEQFDVPEGTTVEGLLNLLVQKYGARLEQYLFSEGWVEGRHYRTASVYVNKKRIQWLQDFPDGIRTALQDGDELTLGLIMGGGCVGDGRAAAVIP